MKHFNNLKLVSTFREVSDILEIITKTIRIFTAVLIILQALLLAKDIKESNKKTV